eukprot:scaffold48_cov311-Pinguiococcus_pyrenoidosus.AAC.276
MKDAFVEVVNRDVGKHKTAALLCSYCDRILKTGGEKMSDEQVEEGLTKLVRLFGYLTEKDLFGDIYRNQLSKRLLYQRSASDDWERMMISKLKLTCGAQFTGKMEGMLNDLSIGDDQRAKFDIYLQDKSIEAELEFSVQVRHCAACHGRSMCLPPGTGHLTRPWTSPCRRRWHDVWAYSKSTTTMRRITDDCSGSMRWGMRR